MRPFEGTKWPQNTKRSAYSCGKTHYCLVPARLRTIVVEGVVGFSEMDTLPIGLIEDTCWPTREGM